MAGVTVTPSTCIAIVLVLTVAGLPSIASMLRFVGEPLKAPLAGDAAAKYGVAMALMSTTKLFKSMSEPPPLAIRAALKGMCGFAVPDNKAPPPVVENVHAPVSYTYVKVTSVG